jgi:thioredoxin 1
MIHTSAPPSTSPLSRRAALGAIAGIGVLAAAAPAFSLAPGFAPYTKEAFQAALKQNKPVLVHVHAEWCPVCKKQEIVFNEISKSPEFNRLTAFTVDFDMETEFKKANNINNQSIVLVFRGGKEVARSGGETDKAKLAAFVAQAVK